MKLKIISVIVVALFLCSGCTVLEYFQKKEPVKSTPEALYSQGTVAFQKGKYKKAREFYARLKEEHPLHALAILADLGIADSYYSDKEYLEAENAYRDFTMLYPTNENVPYALYQIGMCHYLEIGAIDRDQTQAIKAKNEFEKLVARFPQSKFSILAEKMIRDCKSKLAENEFYVGNFYFKQKQYAAALKRFETIVRDYPGVGLDLKVESYIEETRAKIAEQEKKNKLKEEKAKEAPKP